MAVPPTFKFLHFWICVQKNSRRGLRKLFVNTFLKPCVCTSLSVCLPACLSRHSCYQSSACVYICLCVQALMEDRVQPLSVCVYVYRCSWRPELNLSSSSGQPPLCYLKQGFISLGCLASPGSISTSSELELITHVTTLSFSCGF